MFFLLTTVSNMVGSKYIEVHDKKTRDVSGVLLYLYRLRSNFLSTGCDGASHARTRTSDVYSGWYWSINYSQYLYEEHGSYIWSKEIGADHQERCQEIYCRVELPN